LSAFFAGALLPPSILRGCCSPSSLLHSLLRFHPPPERFLPVPSFFFVEFPFFFCRDFVPGVFGRFVRKSMVLPNVPLAFLGFFTFPVTGHSLFAPSHFFHRPVKPSHLPPSPSRVCAPLEGEWTLAFSFRFSSLPHGQGEGWFTLFSSLRFLPRL